MSVVRENTFLEAFKALNENRARREEIYGKEIQESIDNKNNFMNNYYSIMESREQKLRKHGALMEAARNNALGTVIKAIYITALEAGTLTDNGLLLAEAMVDNWIKESGGASAILRESGKTYLLDRITQIVEDAAKEETEDVEKMEKEDIEDMNAEDSKKDNESSDDKESKEDEKDSDNKEDNSSEDEKGEENQDKDEKEEEDPLDNALEDEEPVENSEEDNSDDDLDDDIDEDQMSDEDITIDGDSENNGKVFEELEKEEDIKKAIELIRTRVADAEEAFIKRNTEDKKKIDELLSKISDNVKTVEDIADDDNAQSQVAKEAVMINRRKIKDITNNRPLTVFEAMTRNISENIIKNDSVKDGYVNESGTLDTASVIETAKVMYGFLETLNTLQLENVDADYIKNILENMD